LSTPTGAEVRTLAQSASSVRPVADGAEIARPFVAVRTHRWKLAGEFVKTFEPGLELREAAAKYVEVHSIAKAAALRCAARADRVTTARVADRANGAAPAARRIRAAPH
jgi:hypothetical protein